MYGLVLMTALATGSGTPTYHDGVGCYGGGCYSTSCGGAVVSSGCYSSGCYSSGYHSSCNGCGGGSLFPLFPGLRARVSDRMSSIFGLRGCNGSSCIGSSCYGSSCYGSSCHGSSCYGSSCYGTATYYGSDFRGGCSGCSGGCTGIIIGYAPSDSVPHVSIPSVGVEFQATLKKPNAAPARLTIELPADARLFVDGQLTKGEGTSRNFHTPELPKDQTFFYEIKAEVVVDGIPVSETKRVLVRAGEVLTESFPKLSTGVKTAKDTGALITKAR